MRVSTIKLDANGRARAAGEGLGFCLTPPVGELSAAYPVDVRTNDGDVVTVTGPNVYDLGRACTGFDLSGTPGAEFQLVTFTRPGEKFSPVYPPVAPGGWRTVYARSLLEVTKGGGIAAGDFWNFSGSSWVKNLATWEAPGYAPYVPGASARRVRFTVDSHGDRCSDLPSDFVADVWALGVTLQLLTPVPSWLQVLEYAPGPEHRGFCATVDMTRAPGSLALVLYASTNPVTTADAALIDVTVEEWTQE